MDKEALTYFFRRLDRSFFLEDEYMPSAGCDIPLPIGNGQSISQPSLVAQMTMLLDPNTNSRVLEIGTGSGYQTAFLAEFSREVYTIERIRKFTDKARERLNALGYHNVFYKTGDGSDGWPQLAPFDRIVVTAAAGKMPDALIAQLASGGRMLVPIGPLDYQILTLVCKDAGGNISTHDVEMVRFVELKGRYGWD